MVTLAMQDASQRLPAIIASLHGAGAEHTVVLRGNAATPFEAREEK